MPARPGVEMRHRRILASGIAIACAMATAGCSSSAPGATNMSDPRLAHTSFVDIVRAADSDQIVEVRVEPDVIHVVFRQGDRDVVWSNADEIRQVATHNSQPAGIMSASQIDIVALIHQAQHEGPCADSAFPEVRLRASFSGELLATQSCVSDKNPWPKIRKVTLGAQDVTEIDLFTASGIQTILDEADQLLQDGAITSIEVTNNDAAATGSDQFSPSPAPSPSSAQSSLSPHWPSHLDRDPDRQPDQGADQDQDSRPDQLSESTPATAPDQSSASPHRSTTTATVAGVEMTIGDKQCRPAFIRGERLGDDSSVSTGIDMYSCLKPNHDRPFKASRVTGEQALTALSAAMARLGITSDSVESWSLTRLNHDGHPLAIRVKSPVGAVTVDMDGRTYR